MVATVQRIILRSLEPNGVSIGSATNTTSIEVVVTPPVVNSGILYYEIRGDGEKCEAILGPSMPNCTLSGLVPGKWYNVTATSCGEDEHCSRQTRGMVTTLPEGESRQGSRVKMSHVIYIHLSF